MVFAHVHLGLSASFNGDKGAEHFVHNSVHSPRKNEHKNKKHETGEEGELFFLNLFPPFPSSSSTIHTQAYPNPRIKKKTTMASSKYCDRQTFKNKDGTPLINLQSYPCSADSEERYILWTKVQRAFKGISHLETEKEERILFTIDAAGELYVLLSTSECVVHLLPSIQSY